MIDWQKIEEKGDKKIIIEGKVLLELKSKIDNLEQNSVQNKKEFEKIVEELKVTKTKLSGREKSLIHLTEKRSSTRKILDKIREAKLHTDIQVTKLSAKISDLEQKLAESTEKISTLENKLKIRVENSEEIEKKVLRRDIENQNKEEELLNKAKELLEKEIQKINSVAEQREKEIEFLKKNLEVEKGKTEFQIKRVMSIETNIARADKVLKLLNKIKQSAIIQGFISDKELEQFLIEIED